MIINNFSRVYTNIGSFTVPGLVDWDDTKQCRGNFISGVKFMTKDYDMIDALSVTAVGSTEHYVVSTASGYTAVLPGGYIRHTDATTTASVSSLRTGDTLLLLGAFPDVECSQYTRVPISLNDSGYMEINEQIAQVSACFDFFKLKFDPVNTVLKNIPECCLSDESILFIKNYGGTVLRNITSSGEYYHVNIPNSEFADLFNNRINSYNVYGVPKYISTSPRQVLSSYLSVYLYKNEKDGVITDDVSVLYSIQSLLLTRYGLLGILDSEKSTLTYNKSDIDSFSDIKPIYERGYKCVKINKTLSAIEDKVISIKKVDMASLDLLLPDEKNSILVLDNVY